MRSLTPRRFSRLLATIGLALPFFSTPLLQAASYAINASNNTANHEDLGLGLLFGNISVTQASNKS